jgi:pimeloyl-[acyl-carrier protein] methyl ester esterase
MTTPISILLPGLDGTGDLFGSFVAAAPPGFPARVLPLPHDRPRGYRELSEWVLARLPTDPVVLIAESFSGPLALLVADRCPRVTAVALCASFVKAPVSRLFAAVPKLILRRLPPAALVSFFMTGGDRGLAEALRGAVAGVGADVIAERISAVLRVDVTPELRRLSRPLLWIRAKGDRLVPARNTEKVRALKPSARFVEIESPHLVLQTHPVEAWSQIRSFLQGTVMTPS